TTEFNYSDADILLDVNDSYPAQFRIGSSGSCYLPLLSLESFKCIRIVGLTDDLKFCACLVAAAMQVNEVSVREERLIRGVPSRSNERRFWHRLCRNESGAIHVGLRGRVLRRTGPSCLRGSAGIGLLR